MSDDQCQLSTFSLAHRTEPNQTEPKQTEANKRKPI